MTPINFSAHTPFCEIEGCLADGKHRQMGKWLCDKHAYKVMPIAGQHSNHNHDILITEDEKWQRTRTAHEIALHVGGDYHSVSSGLKTKLQANDTIAASNVMDGISIDGLKPTKKAVEQPSKDTVCATKFGSDAMESLEQTTTNFLTPNIDNVPFVVFQMQGEHSILTTLKDGKACAVFSVINATQELESCDTMQFTVSAPAGTFEHMNAKRFYEILFSLSLLSARKQSDYGRGDDPFANVRASTEWGVNSWVGAMIRLNDKVRRLQSFHQKGTLANEGVDDSLRDIAVYALIALVLFEQEQKK
jgi:hypothetical protein